MAAVSSSLDGVARAQSATSTCSQPAASRCSQPAASRANLAAAAQPNARRGSPSPRAPVSTPILRQLTAHPARPAAALPRATASKRDGALLSPSGCDGPARPPPGGPDERPATPPRGWRGESCTRHQCVGGNRSQRTGGAQSLKPSGRRGPEGQQLVAPAWSPTEQRAGRCRIRADGADSGSPGERLDAAARSSGGRRLVVVGGQRVSPAVAEMVGWRRERTASMISLGSIPCRYVLVVPRSVCPSWRWMMLIATPSRASSTACAWRS